MSIESTSTCAKLAAVGQRLEKSQLQVLKSNVFTWLNDHTDVLPRLWLLMETDLIFELLGDVGSKHLPKSCVRVSSLSQTHVKVLVNRSQDAAYGRILMRNMKQADKDIMQKLFVLKYQFPRSYPLKSCLTFDELFQVADKRNEVLGKRLDGVAVSEAGEVDFSKFGVYAFAEEKEGKYRILDDPSEYKACTHIFHKYAKEGVSLEDLGCPTPNEHFTFEDNFDETKTRVNNGRRMRIDLWPDFKDLPYFNYEGRFEAAWGSNKWKSLVGEDIQKLRDQAKENILDKEKDINKLREEAKAQGAALPVKKRRRLS